MREWIVNCTQRARLRHLRLCDAAASGKEGLFARCPRGHRSWGEPALGCLVSYWCPHVNLRSGMPSLEACKKHLDTESGMRFDDHMYEFVFSCKEISVFKGEALKQWIDVYVVSLKRPPELHKIFYDIKEATELKYVGIGELEQAYHDQDPNFVLVAAPDYSRRLFHFLHKKIRNYLDMLPKIDSDEERHNKKGQQLLDRIGDVALLQQPQDLGVIVEPCKRNEAYTESVWHRAVHVWVFDVETGRLLLQLRSPKKRHFGGKWNCSTGHIKMGDPALPTALKSVQDDVGLKDVKESDFEYMFQALVEMDTGGDCFLKQVVDVYLLVIPNEATYPTVPDLASLSLAKGEVDEVAYIELERYPALCPQLKSRAAMVLKAWTWHSGKDRPKGFTATPLAPEPKAMSAITSTAGGVALLTNSRAAPVVPATGAAARGGLRYGGLTTQGLPMALGVASLAAGVRRAASRRCRVSRKAISSRSSTQGQCGRKTQCLHPDKPMMFACADCPRRNSKAASEDLDAQPMAVAALVGEEVTSNACCRKTQCLHPDKPMMFACADCPRRNSKAASEDLDAQPMAVAALVGEEVTSNACCRKTQCLHPDKPMMFACADCPRRNSKAASEDLDAQPMAVAALVGEEVTSNACCRKTQCLHPDKPMMFACADCPRRNSKAASEDLDAQPMAVAAFVGEEVTSNACCRKTQCLHPDKPMMFACADCPRRNSKAASEDLDAQPMAVAALVGEEVTSNACCRKTQCLHPDKPMMFACADCPRRNSKAAGEDLDAQPLAVAALVGEEVTSNACCRKTQCLHPDKPMMFACADCPRRNSKAASEDLDLDAQPMAVAALVGEEVTSNACCRKTQCLHPDKPLMFACADCPRRNSKAASEDLDAQPMAVAALVGEEVTSNLCG
ncbi:unnamed protein product [Effrenium voratum]|nr:unnamed protein product [Effrenium voratum]